MKKPPASLMLLLALLFSFYSFASPVLNSLPSAAATIYLDFDGYEVNSAYWNKGNPFICAPAPLSDELITEVFNRVAEDYRPFDINITTDESSFLNAPLSSRIRVVITPTSSWINGVGGVALVGSFTWGDDAPAFVFCDRLGPNNAKMVAECCSHESGHTVGLSHQSTYDGNCNLTATYNEGDGSGESGWAPIMGNSYYRNMSGWNNGPTPYGCGSTQDNLTIITSENGFGYRKDDYTDDIIDHPAALPLSGDAIPGIISTSSDKDAFRLSLLENSIIHLDISPYSVNTNYAGANLDIKVSLYNASRQLVRTFDPASTMNVVVDTVLTKGSWYLVVDGTGNANVDDYGSLGSYSIRSSAATVAVITSARLSGDGENNRHNLEWNVESTEPLKFIVLESSTDGTHFNGVTCLAGTDQSYKYTPCDRADRYYRVRATSLSDATRYSNIIRLKGVEKTAGKFMVSTLIAGEISINATDQFRYLLSDINGNAISSGTGAAGANKLDMRNRAGGMYVLQLATNNFKQVEKIIKQ
jgi:hypothetical protein